MDISKQINQVLRDFPHLIYDSNKKQLLGELFITEYDSYDIKIELNGFPKSFPLVYEIGERIPPKMDRHIYPNKGNCCLTTVAKEQILIKTKIHTLGSFISLIVIPFLQNNSFFELNKRYNKGEYSHGVPGVIESYQDILQLDNKYQVSDVLELLIKRKLSISNQCYCGSGYTLGKCKNGMHKKSYNEFKLIDNKQLNDDLYKWINPYLREVKLYQKIRGL